MRNVFNFNPGPAILPEPVLESTSKAILNFANTGMSIMEVSHRSKDFDALLIETQSLMTEIMSIPENYKILFLQGGASLQFAQIPMNLLPADKTADYIDTGNFSKNAIKEAQKLGKVNIAFSGKDESYTILGPWESDPENNVISYLSPLGSELFLKKPGERLKFVINEQEYDYTIKGIVAAKLA